MVGQHDVALFGWIAETLDRTLFLAPILGCEAAKSGANRSYWCNKNFDRLLDEAARAKNPSERETLYELAQAVLDEESPDPPDRQFDKLHADAKRGRQLPHIPAWRALFLWREFEVGRRRKTCKMIDSMPERGLAFYEIIDDRYTKGLHDYRATRQAKGLSRSGQLEHDREIRK